MRRWLLRKTAKHLFHAIEVNELIDTSKMTPEERQGLAADADTILRSKVWNLLLSDMIRVSEKHMFVKSKNETDLIFGKALLYNLEVMDKKLKHLTKLK